MTRHPSSVRFSRQDPRPDESMVKMLAAFVDSPGSLTRQEAEVKAFGHTGYTALYAIDAFHSLRDGGYIEKQPLTDKRFRPTAKGVAALGVFRACEPDGAA